LGQSRSLGFDHQARNNQCRATDSAQRNDLAQQQPSDNAKAWNEWMRDGKPPTGKGDCDTTAGKISIDLGHKLAITGTPTLFFADGERIQGAIPLAQIKP